MFMYAHNTLIKEIVSKSQLDRAQFCLLKWLPGRPYFVLDDQNLNLVASMTTSVIEVGDRKF
jgi:hypothetical protein